MAKRFYSPNDTMGSCDSESIQNAVALAAETGVMHVTIPRINDRTGKAEWVLTEGIRLPSGMCVTLDNCYITLADDVMCNFFVSANAYTPDAFDPEKRMHDITICGIGRAELNGGKPNALNEGTHLKNGLPPVTRNCPIFMINVEGFKVENLAITDQRYWGMRFEFCSRGIIRDIFVCGINDRYNQDGVNLRNGCHDILIENIFGQTGDDMIALSAIDFKMENQGNMIVEGMSWDIHDVVIRNISGAAITHPLVALRNHNGAKIYNIMIENVSDTPYVKPPAKYGEIERYGIIRIGNNSYYTTSPSEMGDTYNIKIRGVRIKYSARGIVTQATLKNCSFTDITAEGPCRSIVAVTPDGWASAPSGVKMEDVTVDGVFFDPKTREKTAVFDFSIMRDDDYLHNVTLRNAVLNNVGGLVDMAENCRDANITTDNVSLKYR